MRTPPSFDAVDEGKMLEGRFFLLGKRHGSPVKTNNCFICNTKLKESMEDNFKDSICSECEQKFPIKKGNGGNK